MKIELTYYHDTGNIAMSFHLINKGEEAFAFGTGRTENEARKNIRGWFTKDSEQHNRNFLCDRKLPYVAAIIKKNGSEIRMDPCINILKDAPIGTSNQLTVRDYTF